MTTKNHSATYGAIQRQKDTCLKTWTREGTETVNSQAHSPQSFDFLGAKNISVLSFVALISASQRQKPQNIDQTGRQNSQHTNALTITFGFLGVRNITML